MKIVNPSVEIIHPPVRPDERALAPNEIVIRHIERCGRVCYKSENLIANDTAADFVSRIIKRGHEAVLEHASFCFILTSPAQILVEDTIELLRMNGRNVFLRLTSNGSRKIVSGNVRAWRDYFLMLQAEGICCPSCFAQFILDNPVLFPEFAGLTSYSPYFTAQPPHKDGVALVVCPNSLPAKEQTVHLDKTLLFVCDRGVSHEIVRHRVASFCQESTRYCNYSKGRFGGEISVIKPLYLDEGTPGYRIWEHGCESAETAYFDLLDCGCSPQEARAVLPNSLKTEVIMTANIQEWQHFIGLRTSSAAHPQMREVATQARHALLKELPLHFRSFDGDV